MNVTEGAKETYGHWVYVKVTWNKMMGLFLKHVYGRIDVVYAYRFFLYYAHQFNLYRLCGERERD